MPKVARLGDMISINCPHGPQLGTLNKGSETCYADGKKVVRITDTATCNCCGQTYTVVTGSDFSYADGLKIARVGDQLTGTCAYGEKCCNHGGISATIITGSPFTDVS